jgi:small subunit ribosomal protein S3
LIIGKGGKEVAAIRDDLVGRFGKQVQLNVHEEKSSEANATLLAENIAGQLERRISTRRAMKQTVSRALRAGAKGVKVMVGGRLNGAEIARSEWYRMGRVPLHTLRARIEYGFAEAMTMYGKIGVKCWVYRGDVLPQAKEKSLDSARDKEKVKSGTGTGQN